MLPVASPVTQAAAGSRITFTESWQDGDQDANSALTELDKGKRHGSDEFAKITAFIFNHAPFRGSLKQYKKLGLFPILRSQVRTTGRAM